MYEKYIILNLLVCFMHIKFCGVEQQHMGGLWGALPISWFFGGYTLIYYLILSVKYNNIEYIDLHFTVSADHVGL